MGDEIFLFASCGLLYPIAYDLVNNDVENNRNILGIIVITSDQFDSVFLCFSDWNVQAVFVLHMIVNMALIVYYGNNDNNIASPPFLFDGILQITQSTKQSALV